MIPKPGAQLGDRFLCARRSAALVLGLAAVLVAAGCAQSPDGNREQHASTADLIAPEVKGQFEQALIAMQANDYRGAATLLERIVATDDSYSGALVNLGIAYKHLERPEDAERALQQAIAADSGNVVAYNELGILQRKAGRFAASRVTYETALRVQPDYAPAHLNLGILCQIYLQDAECAMRHYQRYQALAESPAAPVASWIGALRSEGDIQ
jgi:tetratricopeptide (TPR) repeat protein